MYQMITEYNSIYSMLPGLLSCFQQTNQSGKWNWVMYSPYSYTWFIHWKKPYIMLHDIRNHYPISLTLSKSWLKGDIKQWYFRWHIITFDRDLHETLDSLSMQYSKWNVNEKFDFIVRSIRGLADTRMPVGKYTRFEYKLKSWIAQGIISSIKHRDHVTTNRFPKVQKIPKSSYSCQIIS